MIASRKTRLRVEKFVYEKGTNVALYHAEHSEKYKGFEIDVENGINAQIAYVASDKNLDLLLLLTKSVNPPQELLNQISTLILKKPLSTFIQLAEYLYWAGEQGGQAGLDKLGIDAIFGLTNQQLINYFDDYSKLRINTVDDFTKKWLAQTIQDGKSNGLTPYKIQQEVMKLGEAFSAIRAERIVLTETARAMTTVELETFKHNGIKDVLWKTSRDDRVCPICLPLHNKLGSVSQGFEGGYAGPPAHVSCRCYIEEIIPDNWELPKKAWTGT